MVTVNERSLQKYRQAYEMGILRAIAIEPGPDHCPAVELVAGEYDLWNLPELPLPQCSLKPGCRCTYQALFAQKIEIGGH